MILANALTSAAQEAAVGAAGPAEAAVGGLVADLAPEVGRWMFEDNAGQAAGLVARAVEAATGTANAEAAQAVLATQVASYWLGSSSSSAAKSEQITALAANAQASVPGEIVNRLLPASQGRAAMQ